MAPAHTQIYSAAYQTLPGAPLLPLFAYTAVGWKDGQFVAAGVRVDPDERQDFHHFDPRRSGAGRTHVSRKTGTIASFATSGNAPLPMAALRHGTFSCTAGKRPCPPLPSAMRAASAVSVSRTGGPLGYPGAHHFRAQVEEIAGVAIPHLKEASKAVVSFGQGCEGEPLLQSEVIGDSIRTMRQASSRGTINLNTNGSLPEAVEDSVKRGWTAFASV